MTPSVLERAARSGSMSVEPERQVLLAEGISQSYGPRQALTSLSFSLGAGRVLGVLGPNGAGKTTAVRVLTTILSPSRGTFAVDGPGSNGPIEIRGGSVCFRKVSAFRSGTRVEYLRTAVGSMATHGRAAAPRRRCSKRWGSRNAGSR